MQRPRQPQLDWEDLRYFAALARHGTLSATARAMRVTHATVARRIGSLEGALGHELFDRRPEGYVLNEKGRAALEQVGAMGEHAAALGAGSLPGRALTGLVHVTMPSVLAERFLLPELGGIRERHPGLDISVVTGPRVLSLARREADVAVRLGRPTGDELTCRLVARLAFGFFGTRELAAGIAPGAKPVLVGFDDDRSWVAEAMWLSREMPGCRVAFRSNTHSAQAAAAALGWGVALLPCFVASAFAELVPVDLGKSPPDREVWLLTRPASRRSAAAAAVADEIARAFARGRRLLEREAGSAIAGESHPFPSELERGGHTGLETDEPVVDLE